MKRLLMLVVLSAFLLGGLAYATETRVMTMGGVNNIVKDEANIWLYPSTINYYPKLFIGEAWYDDLWNVGANFAFGEEGDKPMVLGVYFSTSGYDHEILSYYSGNYFADQRLTMFYGREISEMPFGFYFSLFNDGVKNEDTIVANNYLESLTRYEVAFGLSPMQKKLDLTLGLGITTWKDQDYYNAALGVVDVTKPSGNMDIAFAARYWMDPMGKYTLVPHFGLYYIKQGLEEYYDDAGSWAVYRTDELTDMMFDLGLGLNYDASEDILVVGDIGFQMDNYKYTSDYSDAALTDPDDYEDKYLILPYFKIGIDANVFKWMDFRCGVVKEWEKETFEPNAAVKWTWSDAVTETYLGAGFMWGKFKIDAAINTDFLENGPYFISGENDYLTERVTLLYEF